MSTPQFNQLRSDLVRAAVDTAFDHGGSPSTVVAIAREVAQKLGGEIYVIGTDACPVCGREMIEGPDYEVVFVYPTWCAAEVADVPESDKVRPVLVVIGLVHRECVSRTLADGQDIAGIVYRKVVDQPDVVDVELLSAFDGRAADA